MSEVLKIFSNSAVWVPILAMGLAQLTKCTVYSIKARKLDLTWLFQTGGMPSSHSAAVTALSTKIGFRAGFDSPLFAAVLVFSLIVMYDAAGLRRAAGKQARVLNFVLQDMYKGHRVSEERLKELLGHTPLEVIAGAAMGLAIAVLV